jgi:hypothetical protein
MAEAVARDGRGLFGEDGADEADDRGAVGKIPTTSVRRRICLLRRSWGLFERIWRQSSVGNAVKARRSSRVLSRYSAASGIFSLIMSSTRVYWV